MLKFDDPMMKIDLQMFNVDVLKMKFGLLMVEFEVTMMKRLCGEERRSNLWLEQIPTCAGMTGE